MRCLQIVLALALASAAFAQPRLEIAPVTTLGDIPAGRTVPLEISFRNAGDETLIIGTIAPDCGCMVPELEGLRFEPGETGLLPVRFDTTGLPAGGVTKFLTITTNEGEKPRKITLTGTIVKTILATPASLAFTSRNKNLRQEVLIEGVAEGFEVLAAELDGIGFALELETIESGVARLTVEMIPQLIPAPIWVHGATVKVTTTDPDSPELLIPLMARFRSAIRSLPGMVFLYAVTAEKGTRTRVALDSVLQDKLEILALRSSLDFIKLEDDSRTHDPGFIVHLLPNAPLGRFKGELTIESNVEEMPSFTIDIQGTIIE